MYLSTAASDPDTHNARSLSSKTPLKPCRCGVDVACGIVNSYHTVATSRPSFILSGWTTHCPAGKPTTHPNRFTTSGALQPCPENRLATMHSRAALLLRREEKQLRDSPPTGVHAEPVDPECPWRWRASVSGLQGLLYAEATFLVDVTVPTDYDQSSPQVAFRTIPFHPNIHPETGAVEVTTACHVAEWTPGLTLRDVLVGVQTLLSRPRLQREHVVHPKAAQLLEDDYDAFESLASGCVEASLRVAKGLTPHKGVDPNRTGLFKGVPRPYSGVAIPPRQPPPPRAPTIDFDSYHAAWRTLASTAPTATSKARSCPAAYPLKVTSSITPAGTVFPQGVSRRTPSPQCQRPDAGSAGSPRDGAEEVCADELVAWSQGLDEGQL